MALTELPPEAAPEKTSLLQKSSRVATVGVVIAGLYLAWTFYSRHESDVRAAQQLEAKQQAARQEQVKEIFGSGEVKIVSYSIDKQAIAPGQSANLCYGVINATQVELDPPVEPLKPSSFHCLEVAPKKTTTYRFTAGNGKGDTKSVSARLEVH